MREKYDHAQDRSRLMSTVKFDTLNRIPLAVVDVDVPYMLHASLPLVVVCIGHVVSTAGPVPPRLFDRFVEWEWLFYVVEAVKNETVLRRRVWVGDLSLLRLMDELWPRMPHRDVHNGNADAKRLKTGEGVSRLVHRAMDQPSVFRNQRKSYVTSREHSYLAYDPGNNEFFDDPSLR
eukprot:GFKZ01001948.1.p1 GENE.GFKZ01001948.1~~GFKZ01001948.1.p1  ORF type:complete len:177 (-),score=10.98 GFKZ01001948.1:1645-2175(-)